MSTLFADLNGVALLAPVLRALLEQTAAGKPDEDLQRAIGFYSEALLEWIAGARGKKQGAVPASVRDYMTDQILLWRLAVIKPKWKHCDRDQGTKNIMQLD